MKTTQKLVLSAMLAALVFVATYVVVIPSPLSGYINFGDVMVLLAACLLPSAYGFCAAAIGSALADLLAGYAVYAVATFLIKGSMVLLAIFLYMLLHKMVHRNIAALIAFVGAELLMVLAYYLFEGFLYGFYASLVNIPANALQGSVCAVLAFLLAKTLEKAPLPHLLRLKKD